MNLDSVKVLDLSKLLPGPYATQLLADMGADVIKVEPPEGDPARHMTLLDDEPGMLFNSFNCGKKSVCLDLKRGNDLEGFYTLVEDADVMIEQFRPGVVERLSIDYETIRGRNPDIVYCSLTGYGQDGPYSARVGHDLNYQAVSGILHNTRDDDGAPVVPGAPIADMAGGLFATMTIVSALLSRELGEEGGEYIDISMTDVTLSFAQVFALSAFSDGRSDSPLSGDYPCYGVYETADGRYITIAAIEPNFWKNLCEELGRPDLIVHHRAEDTEIRAVVREELSKIFASKPLVEWKKHLAGEGVMFSPVNTFDDILEDPQVLARDIIRRTSDGVRFVGFPAIVANNPTDSSGEVPNLGEHTETELADHSVDILDH